MGGTEGWSRGTACERHKPDRLSWKAKRPVVRFLSHVLASTHARCGATG